MFPWNYGFHWTAGSVIFLGAFYAVIAVTAATVIRAWIRARRAMAAGRSEEIRWLSEFHDLPRRSRLCRHALTGELPGRDCPNAFDCRRCETHAEMFPARPTAAQPAEDEICGLEFPADRFYHRGHTWVRPEPDGTVTVGLDDLARRLVGSADRLDLPRPGTRLWNNGTGWRIRKRGADIRVLAPVDGLVLEARGADCGGWLKLKPVAGVFDLRHLLEPAELRPWVLREVERLQMALTGSPALADGGIPVQDIASGYPDADWDSVCSEFFLEG